MRHGSVAMYGVHYETSTQASEANISLEHLTRTHTQRERGRENETQELQIQISPSIHELSSPANNKTSQASQPISPAKNRIHPILASNDIQFRLSTRLDIVVQPRLRVVRIGINQRHRQIKPPSNQAIGIKAACLLPQPSYPKPRLDSSLVGLD